MTQYIIYAQYDKSQKVIEGATTTKTARQRAYRAAKKYPNAKYIAIETIKDFHTPSKIARTKVKMGEDGKVYATVGRKKRELRSTGDYATDTVRQKSEDIMAWYRGTEKKPAPKKESKPKEQPANLMSSKFMRDHIIVARPAPVKDQSKKPSASALFTWEAFNKKFNYYYNEMYEGRLDDSREWVEKGDRILQTQTKFVNLFVNYRRDIISSDREVAALARAYDYFRKAKMLPPNL